jgi:hypothetical protein
VFGRALTTASIAARLRRSQPPCEVDFSVGVSGRRTWDRWCYAQQHAVRAAREHFKAQVAVAVARAAWGNYWELLDEAERIRERLRARRPARSRAAPHT